jgi:protocatechuate 3,4-dioxygenase beta subunit
MQARSNGLVLLVIVAFGLVAWLTTRDAEAPSHLVDATTRERGAREPAVAGRLDVSDGDRSVVAQESAPKDSAIQTSASPPGATAIVRAHCIDESGQPIPGVNLIGPEAKLAATSGADGRIDGRVQLPPPNSVAVWFALEEAFHVKFTTRRVLAANQVCDLGDVVMPLGGRILGRVVDEKGDPLAGAWVTSTRASFTSSWGTQEKDSSNSTSGRDGKFELDAVPAGSTRVTARSNQYAPSEVSPLDVIAGRELRGVEIKLTEHYADSGFAFVVRVLDPRGEPVPKAIVRHHVRHENGTSTGVETADEHGIWKNHCETTDRLNLRASDPEQRYSAAYAFEVDASRRSIDLMLDDATPRPLIAVDEVGKPIEQFAWRIVDEMQYRAHDTGLVVRGAHGLVTDTMLDLSGSNAFPSEHFPCANHPGGRVDLRTPPIPFVIQLDAPGYAISEVGPFAAPNVPDTIRVILQRLPGVRGRVVATGAGVPGAWVKLFPARGDDRVISVHGFPSRVDTTATAETRSAEDGTFSLALREAGLFIVEAGKSEGTEAETDPLRIDPRVGVSDIELELVPPGTIDGRVLVGANEPARGIVVGASRGEGHPRSTRTDGDGRFQFDKLTPGRWLLRALSEDIEPSDRESRIDFDRRPDVATPFTCDVRSGETSHVEIDCRTKADLVFEIRLAGWDNGIWNARLEPRGSTFSLDKQVTAMPGGQLRIAGDQAGDYLLGVGVNFPDYARGLWFHARVHLDGGTSTWKFDGPCGQIALVNKRDERVFATLECDLDGGRDVRVTARLEPHQSETLGDVPLGHWRRVHSENGRTIEDDRFDVTSDGGARVEWK